MFRKKLAVLVAAALMALMVLVGAMPAFAAPSPQASCIGIGSSSEAQVQARDDISHLVKEVSAEEGTTPGGIYSFIAREHAGSYSGCFPEE